MNLFCAFPINLLDFSLTSHVDKSRGPCHTGRADAVHPRALELLDAWGLADEIANEGPLLNKFTLHRDGVTLGNTYTVPSETTKYRGLHITAQAQIERIYVRDLLRHQTLVERSTTLTSFKIDDQADKVIAKISADGKEEEVVEAYGTDSVTLFAARPELKVPHPRFTSADPSGVRCHSSSRGDRDFPMIAF